MSSRRSRRWRTPRALVLVTAVTIAAVALGTIVLRVAYEGRVLPGIEVGGLALGGASRPEVYRRLAATVRADRPATLLAGNRRWAIRPSEAGYRIDVDATAARALGAKRDGPLAGGWSTARGLFTNRLVAFVAAIDSTRLEGATDTLRRQINRTAFPGALVIDPGTMAVRTDPPRTGRTVARPALRAALLEALAHPTTTGTRIPVRETPTVPARRVRQIGMEAEAFLREPLKVRGAGPDLTIPRADLARVVALEPRDRGRDARLGAGRRALTRLVARVASRRDRRPRNARISAPASFTSLDGQGSLSWRPRRAPVTVSPGRVGRRVDRRALARRIKAALRTAGHVVALPVRRVQPVVTTPSARRVRSLIGTFTTRYEPGQPRVKNIRRIARAVDGTTVAPGERFSLNATAGPRTRSKGYVEAPFIADDRIVPSVGGGVSQFSTTLYNAIYFSGLRIERHQPHSLYIDRYPAGREATLNYPDIDLAWTNDTSAPALIRATSDATSVTVSLYGANGGRRVRAVAGRRNPTPGGDFSITVTREVRYPDGRTRRQPFTTTYVNPQPEE